MLGVGVPLRHLPAWQALTGEGEEEFGRAKGRGGARGRRKRNLSVPSSLARPHALSRAQIPLPLPLSTPATQATTAQERSAVNRSASLSGRSFLLFHQEAITRRKQLPCASVMTFSRTSFFLERFGANLNIFKFQKPVTKTYRPKNDIFYLLITFSFPLLIPYTLNAFIDLAEIPFSLEKVP